MRVLLEIFLVQHQDSSYYGGIILKTNLRNKVRNNIQQAMGVDNCEC